MAMMDDNRVFVDTNVLLAATDTDRDRHAEAIAFLEGGLRGEWRLFATAQIFREYLVVATRPLSANGLGLSPEDACGNVLRFRNFLEILPEDRDTTDQLLARIRRQDLKGKRIHDANLAAAMACHGLRKLKTFNPGDFSSFPEIEIV
jgi:predicted nucleic acid-binding protein